MQSVRSVDQSVKSVDQSVQSMQSMNQPIQSMNQPMQSMSQSMQPIQSQPHPTQPISHSTQSPSHSTHFSLPPAHTTPTPPRRLLLQLLPETSRIHLLRSTLVLSLPRRKPTASSSVSWKPSRDSSSQTTPTSQPSSPPAPRRAWDREVDSTLDGALSPRFLLLGAASRRARAATTLPGSDRGAGEGICRHLRVDASTLRREERRMRRRFSCWSFAR